MSWEFAGVRDPDLLVQSFGEMTREIARDARVGTLDMDRRTSSAGVSVWGGRSSHRGDHVGSAAGPDGKHAGGAEGVAPVRRKLGWSGLHTPA